MADKILRLPAITSVFQVSTSFRRPCHPDVECWYSPRHIQEISGHNDLGTLQRYLEVTPEQRRKAVAVMGFDG